MPTEAEVVAAIDAAFRDYATDGVPASGAHEPVKSAIRTALADIVDYAGEQETVAKPFVPAGEVDAHVVSGIALNSAITRYENADYLDSDTFSADSLSPTTSADRITWTLTDTDKWHMALAPAKKGDELTASLRSTGAIYRGAVIRHSAGTLYVYMGLTGTGFYVQKATGVAGATASGFAPTGYDAELSWQGANVLWSIRVIGHNQVAILFNGMEVLRRHLTGYVQEAGFGFLAEASTSAILEFASRVQGRIGKGLPSIRLVVAGDSNSAAAAGWHVNCRDRLDKSFGVDVTSFLNLAANGADVEDQYDDISALPSLGGGNIVACVLVGTNDIRSAIDVDSVKAAYGLLIDALVAKECTQIVVGIPSMFYDNDLGHPTGASSDTYYTGARYRAAIQKIAGDKNNVSCFIKVVDLSQILGPFFAATDSDAAEEDPILSDNLHFTPYAQEMIGAQFAAGIVSLLANRQPETKTFDLPASCLQANWLAATTGPVVAATLYDDGLVKLDGNIKRGGSSTLTANTTVYQLPIGLRPAKAQVATLGSLFDQSYRFIIGTDGTVKNITAINAAETEISFAGFPAYVRA